MAGLRTSKQYDWKDSNMALFGSETERQVKKESAKTEPAWKKAGQKVGLQIWRIVNFKVTEWPKSDYGKFYDGDSYIVLNTYQEEGFDALLFDVHFWIGKYSTQDEYCTAAYKTVELDTFLDDVPIQHREVQGHESQLFRSYFKTIQLLSGGADSGFKHVEPTKYQPRLLHCHGDRHGVTVKQIARNSKNLDNTDVYILDVGLIIYQWNGSGSNKDERFRSQAYVRQICDERAGKPKVEVVEEGDDEEFMAYLNEEQEEENDFKPMDFTKELYRLSDASGKLTFSLVKTGYIEKSDFDSGDVFILDTKCEIYVWIGKGTTTNERKNAMAYAHNHLMKTNHPLVPVTCLPEGRSIKAFESALAA